MTDEEALELLRQRVSFWVTTNTATPLICANQLAISALRDRIDREKPVALTLDELRGMDWEPVWIVEYPDWGHWELSADAADYLCDRDPDFYGMKHDDPAGKYGLHVLGWLAYRTKPKEVSRMPEYISKEVAIQQFAQMANNADDIEAETVVDMLKAIPAADVQTVVRCGKCEIGRQLLKQEDGNFFVLCNATGVAAARRSTDFCSCGRRKPKPERSENNGC